MNKGIKWLEKRFDDAEVGGSILPGWVNRDAYPWVPDEYFDLTREYRGGPVDPMELWAAPDKTGFEPGLHTLCVEDLDLAPDVVRAQYDAALEAGDMRRLACTMGKYKGSRLEMSVARGVVSWCWLPLRGDEVIELGDGK